MLIILAVLVAIGVVILVVPAIATSVARTVVQGIDRGPSSGSIDQEILEARLGRIEDAIDAMATQLERLGEQQRTLLGSKPDASRESLSDRFRTEPPR